MVSRSSKKDKALGVLGLNQVLFVAVRAALEAAFKCGGTHQPGTERRAFTETMPGR